MGRKEVVFVERTTKSVETLFNLLNSKTLKGLDKRKRLGRLWLAPSLFLRFRLRTTYRRLEFIITHILLYVKYKIYNKILEKSCIDKINYSILIKEKISYM